MSLIERTLSRVRQESDGRSRTAASRSVPAAPGVRPASEPQVHLTDAMREALGFNVPEDFLVQSLAEYRHVKRQLLSDMQAGQSRRALLIASALAGEGKSHTAANLARSIALEPDYTVLLIDGDVINPHITRAMKLTDRPGLTNALTDSDSDVESMVVTTDIAGLSVLPAGSRIERATEYFGSGRMQNLLQALQSVPNRIVLIDSLPLLLTTEARALIPFVGQVVLVVRAESTSRQAVRKALDLIGQGADVKMVLNAVTRTRLSRRLGYGYDYDYTERN